MLISSYQQRVQNRCCLRSRWLNFADAGRRSARNCSSSVNSSQLLKYLESHFGHRSAEELSITFLRLSVYSLVFYCKKPYNVHIKISDWPFPCPVFGPQPSSYANKRIEIRHSGAPVCKLRDRSQLTGGGKIRFLRPWALELERSASADAASV